MNKSKILSGLKTFLKDYPSAKTSFIYGGERYLREDNIEIFPLEEALRKLPVILS